MTLEADLNALRDDVKLWDGVATVLSDAKGSCASLTLSAHEFTGIASREGLVGIYEEVRSLAATLLGEGARNTGAIADALVDVRTQYLDDDVSARVRLAGAWDPK